MRPAATLTCWSMSTCKGESVAIMTNLAAAHHEHQFVTDLPCEHERATALDFWKLGHDNEWISSTELEETERRRGTK